MRFLTPSKEGPLSDWAIRFSDLRSTSPPNMSLMTPKTARSISVYRVHVFFEVSDDNPTYYSRDGVLYKKSNGEKVNCAGFIG